MVEPLKVRIITKEEQEEKYKMLVYLFFVILTGFLLYSLYNYIQSLGFNHNSSIALMISIPLILLILIFRGKKIYWAIRSLSQDKYHKEKYKKQNRKGFFYLFLVGLLLLSILFFQYYPTFLDYINKYTENSKNIKAEDSFLELAKSKNYPKIGVLSNDESEEICSLKCEGNLLSYTPDTSEFYVIECNCGKNVNSLDVMADLDSGKEVDLKLNDYYIDLKNLQELTREEFMKRIGK